MLTFVRPTLYAVLLSEVFMIEPGTSSSTVLNINSENVSSDVSVARHEIEDLLQTVAEVQRSLAEVESAINGFRSALRLY